jgi:hypothetical protein
MDVNSIWVWEYMGLLYIAVNIDEHADGRETYVLTGISKVNKYTLPLEEFDGAYILVGQRFTCASRRVRLKMLDERQKTYDRHRGTGDRYLYKIEGIISTRIMYCYGAYAWPHRYSPLDRDFRHPRL